MTVVTADYDGGVVVMRVAWAADIGTGPNDRGRVVSRRVVTVVTAAT